MSLRKFRPKDIIINTMKAHPSCEFFVFDGQTYYNNIPAQSGAISPTVPVVAGATSLYELNVDRMSGSTTVVGGPACGNPSQVVPDVSTFELPGPGRFIGGVQEPDVIISSNPGDYTILQEWITGPGTWPGSDDLYTYTEASARALVAWWRMEQLAPPDSSTGSFDMTCTAPSADSCPTLNDAVSPSTDYLAASSLNFVPPEAPISNEFISTPDASALSFGVSPLTFAAWIKLTTDTMYGQDKPVILWKGPDDADSFEYGFDLDKKSTGIYKLRVRFSDGSDHYIGRQSKTLGGTFISWGEWTHVAATWDGDVSGVSPYGIKLYINGVEIEASDKDMSPSSFSGMVDSGDKVYIGNRATDLDQTGYKGNISHVSIWNTALAADEIRALYEAASYPLYAQRGGYVASEIVDTGMIYPFVTKDGTRVSLSTVFTGSTYEMDFEYGNVVSASYPLSSSITRELMGWYPAGEGASATFLSTNAPSLYPADTSGGSYGAGQLNTGNPCLISNLSDDPNAGLDCEGDDGVIANLPGSTAGDFTGARNCNANNTMPILVGSTTDYFSQDGENISCNSPQWRHYWALKNLYSKHQHKSEHYALTSSYGIKDMQMINLISIPSIFYGSQIKPGSVSLKWYLTGTLIGELQDTTQNGVLYQVTGNNPYIAQYGVGDPAGVVFYDEGFIALTGSWKLNQDDAAQITMRSGSGGTFYSPTWLDWGAGANDKSNRVTTSVSGGTSDPYQAATTNNFESASFGLSFKGTSETQVLTMFANARRGEANYSNNPTYLVHKVDATGSLMTSSNAYIEDTTRLVVNFVS